MMVMSRYIFRSSLLAFLLLAVVNSLVAQPQSASTRKEKLRKEREERSRSLAPYATSKGEQRARYWERTRPKILTKGYKGFRAGIGGIDDPAAFGEASSGSGWVGSVGYQYGLDRQDFRFSIDGRYSTKQYEQIEATVEFPTARSNSRVQGFLTSNYRDYRQVNFFGLGPDSSNQPLDVSFRGPPFRGRS